MKKTLLTLAIAGLAVSVFSVSTANAYTLYKSDVANIYLDGQVGVNFVKNFGYNKTKVVFYDANKVRLPDRLSDKETSLPGLSLENYLTGGTSFNFPNGLELDSSVTFNAFDSTFFATVPTKEYGRFYTVFTMKKKQEVLNTTFRTNTKYKLSNNMFSTPYISFYDATLSIGSAETGTLSWEYLGLGVLLSNELNFEYTAPSFKLLNGWLETTYTFTMDNSTDTDTLLQVTDKNVANTVFNNFDTNYSNLEFVASYTRAFEHSFGLNYTFDNKATLDTQLTFDNFYTNVAKSPAVNVLSASAYQLSTTYTKPVNSKLTMGGTYVFTHATKHSQLAYSNELDGTVTYDFNQWLSPTLTLTYKNYHFVNADKFNDKVSQFVGSVENSMTLFNDFHGLSGFASVSAHFTHTKSKALYNKGSVKQVSSDNRISKVKTNSVGLTGSLTFYF